MRWNPIHEIIRPLTAEEWLIPAPEKVIIYRRKMMKRYFIICLVAVASLVLHVSFYTFVPGIIGGIVAFLFKKDDARILSLYNLVDPSELRRIDECKNSDIRSRLLDLSKKQGFLISGQVTAARIVYYKNRDSQTNDQWK